MKKTALDDNKDMNRVNNLFGGFMYTLFIAILVAVGYHFYIKHKEKQELKRLKIEFIDKR